VLRQRQVAQFGKRGVDVHELREGIGALAGCLEAGDRDQQRRVGVVFHVAVLAPPGVLAELPAVVAPQDNDRLVRQAQPVEFVEDATQLRVHVADGGVVAMFELARQIVGNRPDGNAVVAAQFTAGQHGIVRSAFRREGI